MSERTYPYTAWVLLPSFKPQCVEFVRPQWSHGADSAGDWTSKDKWYPGAAIHPSLEAAIDDGTKLLAAQQARIDKQVAMLTKRRAALLKAAK